MSLSITCLRSNEVCGHNQLVLKTLTPSSLQGFFLRQTSFFFALLYHSHDWKDRILIIVFLTLNLSLNKNVTNIVLKPDRSYLLSIRYYFRCRNSRNMETLENYVVRPLIRKLQPLPRKKSYYNSEKITSAIIVISNHNAQKCFSAFCIYSNGKTFSELLLLLLL